MIPSLTNSDGSGDLLRRLSDLNSIAKQLQDDSSTLFQSVKLFNGLIKRFLRMVFCLSDDAAVVEEPTFESAIVKVQNLHEKSLTGTQSRAVRPFLKTVETPVESKTGQPRKRISVVEIILHEQEEGMSVSKFYK